MGFRSVDWMLLNEDPEILEEANLIRDGIKLIRKKSVEGEKYVSRKEFNDILHVCEKRELEYKLHEGKASRVLNVLKGYDFKSEEKRYYVIVYRKALW